MIISIGIIPTFLALKTRGIIKILLIVLSLFTIVHGSYHFLDILGFEFMADSIIRPLSVVILMIFGIMTLMVKRKNAMKRRTIKQ
jgi:hypothetical protein